MIKSKIEVPTIENGPCIRCDSQERTEPILIVGAYSENIDGSPAITANVCEGCRNMLIRRAPARGVVGFRVEGEPSEEVDLQRELFLDGEGSN